ncbi:MAG: hypothetical protein LBI85_08735 [Spirochaetaceae bacterium]|nr:hypothetical protein [Spirochaetaceae bacterium]
MNRGIITIAVGAKYIRQAKYLALSCILNTPGTIRAVITDKPEALSDFYDMVIPYNEDYGSPFTLKLQLHRFTPFTKTLFIDADSLVVHPVDAYWELLEQRVFVYAGDMATDGIWYMDIAKTLKRLDADWLPKFNSGMFLFSSGNTVTALFDTALAYMRDKDSEIGYFRDTMLPDEPFLAMALAKLKIEPFPDYGRFSRTLIDAKKVQINVVKRVARFIKQGIPVTPFIVHFCGRFGGVFYFIEKLRLHWYFTSIAQSILSAMLDFIRKLKGESGSFGKAK